MTDKNNPPAFPTMQAASNPYGEMYMYDEAGMSLRDYFAAAALQGLISQANQPKSVRIFAEHAYLAADAMLKVRERS